MRTVVKWFVFKLGKWGLIILGVAIAVGTLMQESNAMVSVAGVG